MKRKTCKLLLWFMLFTVFNIIPVFEQKVQAAGINIGDYVMIGKYYDEPILWRCVDIDENGPLMLSDKILCLKPFDAKGTHPNDYNSARLNRGSNLWETSNIRSWLNSTASVGNVIWACGNLPASDNVYKGHNSYDSEKGFLAEGNFTPNERMTIKTVSQKSLLNYQDKGLATGGTTTLTEDIDISSVVQNYDNAYYNFVSDNIFLLDVKQINKVYQNENILGKDYFVGKVTAKAVANSNYKYSSLVSGEKWDSWLRTPYAGKSMCDSVRYVDSYNTAIDSWTANNGDLGGVRPALYLDLTSTIMKSGNGSVDTPYIIDGGTPPVTTSQSIKYTYDKLNRVTSATYNNGVTDNYNYDAAGNILSIVRTTSTSVVVTSVELKPSETLTVGQTKQLIATVLPIDAIDIDVTWSISSGNGVVSVTDGLVTALTAGTAIVRATSTADNTKYDECIITVTGYLKQDVNKDGKVDILDINEVGEYYNLTRVSPGWIEGYDMNDDGIIDILDLVYISKYIQ